MFKKLLIATALLLTTVSCNHSMLGQTLSPSTNPGKPSYLFVIMSDYGMIQQTSNGEYQLILDHSDVEKVLAFTNRPYRLVKHSTAEGLKTMWTEGNNSFAEDPPNATIIINQHLQTVILTSVSIEGDKTIFTIKSDGTSSLLPIAGACQIFIDGAVVGKERSGPYSSGAQEG